ncbi:hypothetical protein IVB33_29065 [Bradyrhizobium sp. 24]|uniref:hypothetical protein n=1 Tax=unclassified Bradyrhizobium TaxID=2631580 RepID=UPI001FF9A647|nr:MULTISPECIES: hypothetical protein [unclassified Bradyrhizobium]MCK1302942.1 hypothetical protein [Bradyrhizobium sp. 37]MCK1381003.1 hypothetical protein [Bradyrhizobium sp. 24]MCK1772438.1 hypothetical protein [Bradyrhizobium sp. 134]
MHRLAQLILFLSTLTAASAYAQQTQIGGTSVRTLPCQAIELDDQKITVCIEPKREMLLGGPACGFVAAGVCWSNTVSAPVMAAALPLVKAAKDRGAFRDQGECEEIARDAGRLGGIVGGSIAGALAGQCGECVCRAAY